MNAGEIFDRYQVIINSLRRGQKPTIAELCKRLNCSVATIRRYKDIIYDSFGIEIKYDRYKNGYFIDYDSSINIKESLKFFDMLNSAQIMINSLKDGKATLNYLSLDSSENLKGIEFMEQLMTAVKMNRLVTFRYHNFKKGTISENTVRPYLLREYQNRWFLYGENENYSDFRIYGIERMLDLKLTDIYFVPKDNFDPKKDFENIIGIATVPFLEGQPIQDIILTMTEEQGRYFKSLPWHSNYKTLVDEKDEFRVKLHILPNYEFAQILYKYCDKVTVLEPQWLCDWLKEKFRTSSEKYF